MHGSTTQRASLKHAATNYAINEYNLFVQHGADSSQNCPHRYKLGYLRVEILVVQHGGVTRKNCPRASDSTGLRRHP